MSAVGSVLEAIGSIEEASLGDEAFGSVDEAGAMTASGAPGKAVGSMIMTAIGRNLCLCGIRKTRLDQSLENRTTRRRESDMEEREQKGEIETES